MYGWVRIPASLVLLFLIFVPYSSASFVVYYGQINHSKFVKLKNFDILILSPTVDSEYVSKLSPNHTVVGYLSLATIGGWEPWAKNVSANMVIGENRNWGEKIVNFSSPEWKQIILKEAIPYILSKGFNGVFLDNLDYVDLYPDKKGAMVDLVKSIRERYPNITIIVNRGFSVAKDIAPYVNYFLFEDFVTYYDFNNGRYKIFGKNDLQWEFDQVKRLKSLNVPVLALSYADLDNESQLKKFSSIICRYARQYNISEVYITDVGLQRIGLDPCKEGKKYLGIIRSERHHENKRVICGPVTFLLLVVFTRFILRWRLS